MSTERRESGSYTYLTQTHGYVVKMGKQYVRFLTDSVGGPWTLEDNPLKGTVFDKSADGMARAPKGFGCTVVLLSGCV